MLNLKKCHSILILSNSSDDSGAKETARIVSFLKQGGKEVFALHCNENEKETIVPQITDIKVFGKDHLNKIFTPIDTLLLKLVDREFDLLIDLSIKEIFPLKYIFVLSKSKFKVGPSLNYKNTFGDMTIDITQNQTVTYFITQVKHYLTQINQEEYVV